MAQGWAQIVVFLVILTALVPLVGGYIARVFQGERVFLSPLLGPVERLTYRVLRVRPGEGQDWKAYARSVIVFSLLSWLLLYLILRTQSIQPFNPEGFHSGPWNLSFCAAQVLSCAQALCNISRTVSSNCCGTIPSSLKPSPSGDAAVSICMSST